MNLGNYSTITSGIEKYRFEDFEVEHFNINSVSSKYLNKILVLDNNATAVSDYDFALNAMYKAGYRIIISAGNPNLFNTKALNAGLFPIEISNDFLDKMNKEYTEQSRLKLFIDMVGQEVMIVRTGEKEFFKLSDYKKDCLLNGFNDVDYIYCVYDDITCTEKSNFENELTYAFD